MRRRYVQINGELREVELDWSPEPRADVHVIPDIKPYRSMIDGSMIGSRSTHREHLRQHGCVEVGNDSSLRNPQARQVQPPPGLRDAVAQSMNEVLEKSRRR